MRNHYRIWIALSFVVIFAAGVVGGILLEDRILDRRRDRAQRERTSVHFPTLENMAGELNLTAGQQEQIRTLFRNNEDRFKDLRGEIHTRLSAMRSQMITEIKSVLDEGQNEKFDAMIEKYKARRMREHEERKRCKDESGEKR